MQVLKKCGNRRVDRINGLPDDIILHILSFLPTTDATRAGLVCRRWLYLWGCIPNLRFNFPYKDIYEIIPHVELALALTLALKSHKALSFSLQEFKLHCRAEEYSHHYVGRWLAYAFSRGVERLDLTLRESGACFDKQMLKEIASFESLNIKVLFLRCFKVSADAVALFLRNCPVLERLLIHCSRRWLDLVVDSPSLKHLDMRERNFKSILELSRIGKYSTRVCAPNLTCLTLDHNTKALFLESVPKLVNLHFYHRSDLGDSMRHFANVAAQLETLIIHYFTPEAPLWVPAMPKLKKLVIYYRFNWDHDSLAVTRFITASPCLEEFRLEISELYFSYFPSVPVDIFEVPKAPSPHFHLKRFVFSGYRGCDKDFGHFDVSLELVRYMVDNCVALEELVIGQCDRVGLVRDIVDYSGESLEDLILDPKSPKRYVPTLEERHAFEKIMERQQIPAHIKLRIVYQVDT